MSEEGAGAGGLFKWAGGLCLSGCGGWYLDSRMARQRAFVSHAHSDHLPWGDRLNTPPDPATIHGEALCTPATAAIGRYRCGMAARVIARDYFEPFALDEHATAELLPAGHVLGSAMLHVQRDDGASLLYTGDFKLRAGRTLGGAELREAEVLLMESTYGTPFWRFPPAAQVEQQLVELTTAALRGGRQPIVYGYSLGKAQEIVRILTDAGLTVTQHGAVARMSAFYEGFGVPPGPPRLLRTYLPEDFRGESALDLEERGVLVAPPDNARTGFTLQFGEEVCRIVITGWALAPGARFRYGVDHALPLSDHADFDELVETIERVRPKRVLTTHGFAEFPEHLARLGIEAELARPPAQMSLF